MADTAIQTMEAVVLSGSTGNFVLPSGARSFTMWTPQATVNFLGDSASGEDFLMVATEKYTFGKQDIAGHTLYFEGTGTIYMTVEVGSGF